MALALSPETEQKLLSEAERIGIPVGDLINQMVAHRFYTAPNPPDDTELERVARQEPAYHLRDAYQELALKQRTVPLSDAEHEELLRLLEHLDSHHVRRMEAVAELAKRHSLSLLDAMQRYGVRPLPLTT